MEVYSASLKGNRAQNEDNHKIVLNSDGREPNKAHINYFAVYDGHGGKFVSNFLKKNLHEFFIDTRVKFPLRESYINKIYKHLQDLLRTKFLNNVSECGSTCLVAIQNKEKEENNTFDYMYVLNSGDSRCILCRDTKAHALTDDHKPSWPKEKTRIEKLGGTIRFDGYDYRIKDLSVSRAFGDVNAEPYLTNMPEIYKYKLSSKDRFMVLACDGLWDVMENTDVVNFILKECYDNTLENRINKKMNIATKLAEHAISIGSNDNITAIVVFFD